MGCGLCKGEDKVPDGVKPRCHFVPANLSSLSQSGASATGRLKLFTVGEERSSLEDSQQTYRAFRGSAGASQGVSQGASQGAVSRRSSAPRPTRPSN